MFRSLRLATILSTCFALTVGLDASVVHAGLFDKLKKKVEAKVGQNTDKAADPGADKAANTPPATSASKPDSDGKASAVSTKFDFVPGDNVMFFDDFKLDELGEFPVRWNLSLGTFEVVESQGERWLRCTSADGRVRMKLPAMASLPEFWTLEFDFFAVEPMASALTVQALGGDERAVWEAVFPQGNDLAFRSGDIFSTTPYEGTTGVGGRHHVMFMARGKGIKAYLDRQRMASVPDISTAAGMPSQIEFRLWASTQPMITSVRFAEGCRPPKDMLAEGKLVTYGIRFETGSDGVRAESAPVLRQISAYLEANPEVKLQIVGHTDNVGSAASNLDLSKRRAASVARILSGEFNIAADRFKADGKGDTQPVSSNAKPEGRAMNRRVEFIKL
jgi:outer membrane protein OmpA-like peptidoglycan-associated protein